MKNKKQNKVSSIFETCAIVDNSREDKKEHIDIPSHAAIEDAKEWVDYNEK